MSEHPATVTVVTSPAGVDIGPVAAHLGRDLGDGLAVRTTDTRHGAIAHASPTGYAAGHIVTMPGGGTTVDLECLPSAWQNPDTNLGVACTHSPVGLVRDLQALGSLGLNPAHRITVQLGDTGRATVDNYRAAGYIPGPISVGNLAEAARDSVLRGSPGGSRRVLVEAGDGQTFLQALATLGLAPWEPSIDVLDLWLVADAATASVGVPGTFGHSTFADTVRAEVIRQGGGVKPSGERLGALHLAVLNVHTFIPELAGVDGDRFMGSISEDVVDSLGGWLATVERRTGARVDLVSTGVDPEGRTVFIDLRSGTD